MPRPPALSQSQEALVRERVRAGADLPALEVFAAKQKIKVSRAKLGQVLKDERERPSGPPPVQVGQSDLAGEVAALRQQVASLEGRFTALICVPKVKLSEAASAAVHVAQLLLGDPLIDPKAKASIMAQLPDLIEAARKALEAERDGSTDDELGI